MINAFVWLSKLSDYNSIFIPSWRQNLKWDSAVLLN